MKLDCLFATWYKKALCNNLCSKTSCSFSEWSLFFGTVPFKWQLKWLGKSFQQMQKLFPLGKMNFKKDYLKVHTDWRLAAGTIHHFISTPHLNANYPLCENSRDQVKWISQSTKNYDIMNITNSGPTWHGVQRKCSGRGPGCPRPPRQCPHSWCRSAAGWTGSGSSTCHLPTPWMWCNTYIMNVFESW